MPAACHGDWNDAHNGHSARQTHDRRRRTTSGADGAGRLDAAMLERMRGLAGTELRIDHSVNNDVARRLAVERFADAIGDPDPLWRDADRAASGVYGAPVAPPSFVMGCFSGLQFGLPVLGSFHSGSELAADDGEACVRVRTWSRNQRGEELMPGGPVIALLRRGGASPAERRLRWSDVNGGVRSVG